MYNRYFVEDICGDFAEIEGCIMSPAQYEDSEVDNGRCRNGKIVSGENAVEGQRDHHAV